MARTRATKEVKKDEDGSDVEEASMDGVEDASLPPKPVESMKRKMIIAKTAALQSGISLYAVRHPRLATAALFQLGKSCCEEVLLLEDEYRCLMTADTVISDGRPRLLAPYHPLFLVLPYLEAKKARYETLEEILKDAELPAIERLAENEQALAEMELVADKTDVCDEVLFKLSEPKWLAWLEERFALLKAALLQHARLHDSITKDDEVLSRYAFGVLGDHLSGAMAARARAHLGIKDPVVAEAAPEPLGMGGKRKLDDDENLYSSEKPPAKKTPTQSATQKKLQQASKGTKSLSSFFGKKAN